MNPILVDSNVLIYAINKSSPKYKSARTFLKNIYKVSIIYTAQQNINESIRILTHRKFVKRLNPKVAVKKIKELTDNFSIVSPKVETIFLLMEFVKKYELAGDKIFDAYLVATAMTNDINIIATDNTRDFKMYEEIKILNPFV